MSESKLSLQTVAVNSSAREPSGALLSPDEKYLAAFRSGEILVWPLPEFQTAIKTLKSPCGVFHNLDFSRDGKLLAAATDENQVVVWSFPQGEKLTVLDGNRNKESFFKNLFGCTRNQVVFSPDGKYLASRDNSGKPLLWETRNFSVHKHIDEPVIESEHNTMAFSSDSAMLLIAHGHAAVLYDVDWGTKIEKFIITAESLAFHPSKKQFAVGRRDLITLFDPQAPETQFRTMEEDRITSINEITFTSDGEYLLAVGTMITGTARCGVLYGWSLSDGETVLNISPAARGAVSPDNSIPAGARIYMISRDKLLVSDKTNRKMTIMQLAPV